MNIKVCRNCGKILDDKDAVYNHVQIYGYMSLKTIEYEMCLNCKRWLLSERFLGILKKYKEIDK